MTSENYARTIHVDADPSTVFWALTKGMHKWWTMPDAAMKKVGDRAKFTFPPGKSYWTFEATVLEPDKRVEMVCVDAHHLHEGQPEDTETEWLDTRIVWTIAGGGNKTDIHLEHDGLVPTLHCYDICEQGWDFFFAHSLQAFLDTGTGNPHRS